MAYKSLLDENDVKLVAIAKERVGHEQFVRDHWSEEIYFDEGVIPGLSFKLTMRGHINGPALPLICSEGPYTQTTTVQRAKASKETLTEKVHTWVVSMLFIQQQGYFTTISKRFGEITLLPRN